MERVTRGRVKKVQVRLQRRSCCDALVLPVIGALSVERMLQETLDDCQARCCASQRLHQARHSIHSRVQAAAAARAAGGPDILDSLRNGDGASVLCHLIADADGVNKRSGIWP
jgi:hypothetical protein